MIRLLYIFKLLKAIQIVTAWKSRKTYIKTVEVLLLLQLDVRDLDVWFTFGYHTFQRDFVQFPSVTMKVIRRVQVCAAVFVHRKALRRIPSVRAHSDFSFVSLESFGWTPTSGGLIVITVTQIEYDSSGHGFWRQHRRHDQIPAMYTHRGHGHRCIHSVHTVWPLKTTKPLAVRVFIFVGTAHVARTGPVVSITPIVYRVIGQFDARPQVNWNDNISTYRSPENRLPEWRALIQLFWRNLSLISELTANKIKRQHDITIT